MSALPPKADIAERNWDVCFVPKADIQVLYSITSSATASSDDGTVILNILAVCMLMTRSNLFACTTGRSAGLALFNRRQLTKE
jgi:hypothetical protein